MNLSIVNFLLLLSIGLFGYGLTRFLAGGSGHHVQPDDSLIMGYPLYETADWNYKSDISCVADPGTEFAIARTLQVTNNTVSFYAMGDVPYNLKEEALFPVQIRKLSDMADFAIHLGDMQHRRPQCTEPSFRNLAAALLNASLPVFIVPGDNDWYDCVNREEAFGWWGKYFYNFSSHWNDTNFTVEYDDARPENFAMALKQVLFVSVNTPRTGSIRDQTSWDSLDGANAAWFLAQIKAHGANVGVVVIFAHAYSNMNEYNQLWTAIHESALLLKKPFLYMQGDTHRWLEGHPFRANNVLRVVVDRGGIADPVLVTVDPSNTSMPFTFLRRPLSTMP